MRIVNKILNSEKGGKKKQASAFIVIPLPKPIVVVRAILNEGSLLMELLFGLTSIFVAIPWDLLGLQNVDGTAFLPWEERKFVLAFNVLTMLAFNKVVS